FPLLSHPTHSHPPSSPTRRSSDLAAHHLHPELSSLVVVDLVAQRLERADHHAGVVPLPQPQCGAAATGADLFEEHLVQRQVDDRDRKSTRLNSSHVSISYAVFCLK